MHDSSVQKQPQHHLRCLSMHDIYETMTLHMSHFIGILAT